MMDLKNKILKEAKVPKEGILKVDNFLNHQIDPELMMSIGNDLAERLKHTKPTKILTVEASGIAPALGVALALNIPLVFAKKSLPSTMIEGYQAKVHSFTKKTDYNIFVSAEYLQKGERILIIDDFLAMGNSIVGMLTIIEESGAECVGIGIVIEKTFQNGRNVIKKHGLPLESLVKVSLATPDKIEFED